METKKLYRSCTNRMVGGVCGGLGKYLGIDPTLVRLFFVLLTLGQGFGVALYLVLWVIIPREDRATTAATEETARAGAQEIAEQARTFGSEIREAVHQRNPQQIAIIAGSVFVVIGVVFLLQNLNIAWLWWLNFDIVWPILLIAAGVLVIVNRVKGE